jgi:hypothetical protein
MMGLGETHSGSEPIEKEENLLLMPEIEPQSSSPSPSHYTDYAIPASVIDFVCND